MIMMLGLRSAATTLLQKNTAKTQAAARLLAFIERLLQLRLEVLERVLRRFVADEVLQLVRIGFQVVQLVGIFNTDVADVFPLRRADGLPGREKRVAGFVEIFEQRAAAPLAALVLEERDQ